MAPQEEAKKEKREREYRRVTNWIKRKLRKRGWLLSHLKEREVEARINVEKELAKEGILTIFQTKMSLLWTIENTWSEFTGYWLKLQEEYKKVGCIRDAAMAYKEAGYLKNGTRPQKAYAGKTKDDFIAILGQVPDSERTVPLDKETLKNIDRIRIDVKDQNGKKIEEVWVEYPVSIEAPLKLWSSMINNRDKFCRDYVVTYTGFTRAKSWIDTYTERINKAIDEFWSKLPPSDTTNTLLETNLGTLKTAFHDVISKLFTDHILPRENDIYKKIKEKGDAATDLEILRTNIEDTRPDKFVDVYFKHTYKTINPDMIMYPTDYDRLMVLREKGRKKALVVDISKGVNEEEELKGLEEIWGGCIHEKDLKPIQRKGRWERVPGLDENGWPLEVTYPGYKFGDWVADDYYVLLDIFNQTGNLPGNARPVDKKFTAEMDLLLMANCMNNEWDAVRDDVRDGRYHTESLTILDYLMITTAKDDWASGITGWRWVEGEENKLKDNTFAERFRSPTMTYFDGTTRKERKVIRRPNNLIPAFDKRGIIGKKEDAREEFVHLGRKYYYEYALRIGDITDEEKKKEGIKKAIGPTLTTRGISMWIIYKILFGMKFYDEARARLVKIAQDRGVWYDYGPRDFNVKALAPDGTPDPMNLDLTSANESLNKGVVYEQFKSAIQKVEKK